jgi:hypothetical protein
MYTLLKSYDPETNEFALSLRDLDKNTGWKIVDGFYRDPVDAMPKPFTVEGCYETETDGRNALAFLKMFYEYHNKAIRVDVCTVSKYRFTETV